MNDAKTPLKFDLNPSRGGFQNSAKSDMKERGPKIKIPFKNATVHTKSKTQTGFECIEGSSSSMLSNTKPTAEVFLFHRAL